MYTKSLLSLSDQQPGAQKVGLAVVVHRCSEEFSASVLRSLGIVAVQSHCI